MFPLKLEPFWACRLLVIMFRVSNTFGLPKMCPSPNGWSACGTLGAAPDILHLDLWTFFFCAPQNSWDGCSTPKIYGEWLGVAKLMKNHSVVTCRRFASLHRLAVSDGKLLRQGLEVLAKFHGFLGRHYLKKRTLREGLKSPVPKK